MPDQAPYPETPWWQAQKAPEMQELSSKETEDIWNRSGEMSKDFPYEHTGRESLMRQLDSVGEAIIRKGSQLGKDLVRKPLKDHEMMMMNREYFMQGLSDEQRKATDDLLYIRRRPLTS
jgi:hypothetical protein